MNELMYFTGEINSPFFTNEINYFCTAFDKVHVIAYNGEKTECDKIAAKYDFSYQFINTPQKRIENIPALLAWRKRDYVKDEFQRIKEIGKYSWKTVAYIYLYGFYAIAVEKIIKEHIKMFDELYFYSFWLSRPAFAIASMNIGRDKKIRNISSRTHRYDLYEEENEVGYLPFRKFISENLDTIYFSSRDTYDYYVKKKYSDNQCQAKRKLSYLGTNEPKKRKKEKNSDTIVLASCAYIIHRKRLDLIIKVVGDIARLGYRVKWIHVGGGELYERFRMVAQNTLNVSTVDYTFTGRLSDEDIYELYVKENVDFFINMSDSEGIPVSIIEALSMGIPSIARNVGGNADAIIDRFNGILIDKNSISDSDLMKLSKSIIEIFSNPEQYMQMSNNAYNHWNSLFNGACNTRKVCEDMILSNVIPDLV